ncbi:bicyclomycin resistance protein [Mytilinidion resinicola]|uniref:Bicyclomycin resistance protein n=1 Tax=Mytilinidion resinicola TaxID=574789 RepID=A0A6A6XYU3_9PEZI|nr:bicyclomycin resistance protein [Mytilinidion resinicola]KAF2801672.1 bicyclomycin resistance protein [Mytilinidion resinicola]
MSHQTPPVRRASIVHSPTGLSEHELRQEAVTEGHDADIATNDGFILNAEGELQLQRSISRRHSLSRQNTASSEKEAGQRKKLSSTLQKTFSRSSHAASLPSHVRDIPKDLEAAATSTTFNSEEEKLEFEKNTVWWDGPNDPANPRNWSTRRKAANVILISFITLLTPLASSICAPAIPEIMLEFDIKSSSLAAFVVSCYVLGFALGPLVIAPLSEVFGRVPVYHICNVCFVLCTVGCAKANSTGMLIAFRLLCGIFGSCPLTNGGGSIHDLVPAEQRGKVAGVFGLGPLLGPIIGPIGGGFLAQAKGWRWVFWLITIVSGTSTLVCFVTMKETYAPVILQRKTRALRASTGNLELRSRLDTGRTTTDLIRHALLRPLKILFLSPVVIAFSVYLAIVYGYIYLLFTTITPMYEKVYGWNTGMTGLAYLGMGIGSLLSLFVFSHFSDKLMKERAKAESGSVKPEYRLPPMIYGAISLPIGLFWYGWSADQHIHWIMPILGTVFVGAGMLLIFMCTLTYIVDSFALYAASALAANTMLRSVVGAVLPLAGTPMYNALGIGWGNSLLGFIAVALVPLPIVFGRYGEYLRTKFEIKNL